MHIIGVGGIGVGVGGICVDFLRLSLPTPYGQPRAVFSFSTIPGTVGQKSEFTPSSGKPSPSLSFGIAVGVIVGVAGVGAFVCMTPIDAIGLGVFVLVTGLGVLVLVTGLGVLVLVTGLGVFVLVTGLGVFVGGVGLSVFVRVGCVTFVCCATTVWVD